MRATAAVGIATPAPARSHTTGPRLCWARSPCVTAPAPSGEPPGHSAGTGQHRAPPMHDRDGTVGYSWCSGPAGRSRATRRRPTLRDRHDPDRFASSAGQVGQPPHLHLALPRSCAQGSGRCRSDHSRVLEVLPPCGWTGMCWRRAPRRRPRATARHRRTLAARHPATAPEASVLLLVAAGTTATILPLLGPHGRRATQVVTTAVPLCCCAGASPAPGSRSGPARAAAAHCRDLAATVRCRPLRLPDGEQVTISASIGLAHAPQGSSRLRGLRAADARCTRPNTPAGTGWGPPPPAAEPGDARDRPVACQGDGCGTIEAMIWTCAAC